MLFRVLTELIVIVIVITVLRSVIGVVMKIISNVFGGPQGQPGSTAGPGQVPQRPSAPSGGELKKDPVCGTFISSSTTLQKRVGSETYYFCSAECRDKFQA
jgi:YHS domain-containing protein